MALDLAGVGAAGELGPGMAWLDRVALTIWETYRASCTIGGDASAVHTNPLVLAAMWALMSVAMMAPTALPFFASYLNLPFSQAGGQAKRHFWSLLAGYLAVWFGFSILAAALQKALVEVGLTSIFGVSASPWLSAGLLAIAGAYQFSNFKHACLSKCRAPFSFFMENWRDGRASAFRLGLRHGQMCLGCCWALMLLAFVGGTMNLVWMGIALVIMTIEKLPIGRVLTAPLGVLFVGGALVVVVKEIAI